MGGLLEAAYRHSPLWLQSLGIAAYGAYWRRRRLSGAFPAAVERFSARDRYTSAEWERYQRAELRRLLLWCYDRVPHYRRTWSRLGLSAADLALFELADLSRLPCTEKEQMRAHPDDFLARGIPRRKLVSCLTSGTTGTPLAVRMQVRTHQVMHAAYEVRCRRWAGVSSRSSRAMIGGRLVVPEGVARPPYWRYNPFERQLYLSAFHIAPGTVRDYVGALNRFRPEYLVGYAASHYFLARMIREAGLPVWSPKVILTSSERLTTEMRATLSTVYQCEVFDAYSGVETCCLASECSEHRLHVSPDVGIVELLGERGAPVADGGEGEIVATGLLNYEQPLVRYRTGDLAAWAPASACPCGRSMPVLRELVGRLEDTVVGADGREVVRFHGVFLDLASVREAQIIQEALDHVRVRVVPVGALLAADRARMETRLRERLGPIEISFEEVPRLPRTANGKVRAVVSKVKRARERTTV